MIGPRAAQFGALFGEHAAYFIDPLEVAVAEALQPVADRRFKLESYRRRILPLTLGQVTARPTRRGRLPYGPDRPAGTGAQSEVRLPHEHTVGSNGLGVTCLRDSPYVGGRGLLRGDPADRYLRAAVGAW